MSNDGTGLRERVSEHLSLLESMNGPDRRNWSIAGRLLEELAALSAVAPPADWVLVPREPTDEMCAAAMQRIKEVTTIITDGPTKGATLVREPAYNTWKAMLSASPAAPAQPEGVEAVGAIDQDGRPYLTTHNTNLPHGTKLYTRPAPAQQAWQPKPTESGHYWHFDGELTRMQFVFPRPGHSYLAVYDESNPTTGKRQFRMAEKMGGQWYGPLTIPALTSNAAASAADAQEGVK